MDVLAVSPESNYADEAVVISALLSAGLTRYHLRKPDWSADRCAKLIELIPQEWRECISIHQHYELAGFFGVGVHFKDAGGRALPPASKSERCYSRSLHCIENITTSLDGLDYAFLSPVFASITKAGYAPSWSALGLRAALLAERDVKLYALGGITAGNAGRAVDLGFDGVVLHGALWMAEDPVGYFTQLRKAAV